ncbi:NnrS family protein [Motilimonas pumila]|uniref:Short-chain dehydrogenase n=1 Tax=Motilimonas pumila TaxID=2303987 RepID=A0A418YHA9_9GAMM|nr:NnrS family protein [Motilimonas pumila]RJG49491.1 short-chain dehydrogenase [Motilimonas pumila]
MLNIVDKAQEEKILPVFRLGFRPFFLLAAIYAILSIPTWLWLRSHGSAEILAVPALWWHAHELLFGFALAVVMGFVLTAVQNWTGQAGTKGIRLGLLAGLWLLPRVLFWTAAPLWLIATIECAFIGACAWETGIRVVRSKGWRNLFFVPLFLAAMVLNLLSYQSLSSEPWLYSGHIWQAMLWWFVLLLSIMGARVIPFFTAKRLGFTKPEPIKWLEYAANAPLLALLVLSFIPAWYLQFSTPLYLMAGLLLLARMMRWRGYLGYKEPLLWSLHLSFAFIPLGLLVLASGWFAGLWMVHLHLIAIGAVGGLILAMISRVTLGHTGYNIYQGPNMALAFAVIALAALVRTFAVLLWPQWQQELLWLAAGLWCLAFAVYLCLFGAKLCQPRVDGHPG